MKGGCRRCRGLAVSMRHAYLRSHTSRAKMTGRGPRREGSANCEDRIYANTRGAFASRSPRARAPLSRRSVPTARKLTSLESGLGSFKSAHPPKKRRKRTEAKKTHRYTHTRTHVRTRTQRKRASVRLRPKKSYASRFQANNARPAVRRLFAPNSPRGEKQTGKRSSRRGERRSNGC